MARVTNNTSQPIDVAINQWGNDGNTSYFTIGSQGSDSWGRSDIRGFVMSLRRAGSVLPYFILHNSEIVVEERRVLDHNQEISPVTPSR